MFATNHCAFSFSAIPHRRSEVRRQDKHQQKYTGTYRNGADTQITVAPPLSRQPAAGTTQPQRQSKASASLHRNNRAAMRAMQPVFFGRAQALPDQVKKWQHLGAVGAGFQ